MKLDQLNNKKIAIWGYGVEGKSAAEYLQRHDIEFSILCSVDEADEKYYCVNEKVTTELLNQFDVVVKSPGISPYQDLIQNSKLQFTSPTALWFANEKHTNVIAITGTKGKSTISSLLTHVIAACGKTVNLVGNIGQALLTSKSDYDFVVFEASSFQIYDGQIHVEIALVNNLFPEHLDWHKGEENYFRDKLKIFDFAKTKIINANNQNLQKYVRNKSCVEFNSKDGFYVVNDELYLKDKAILKSSEIQLIGTHNLENVGAVLTICQLINLDLNQCLEAVKTFQPLAHRLQYLGKIGKHHAINDSISTTPIATMAALGTVDRNRTILLVGGFDRGNDWTEFAESLNESPPKLLLISGANGKAIYNHLQSIDAKFSFTYCKTLAQAIKMANTKSNDDDIILLSPGAPSFDQFKSYIERGDFFQQELKKYEI